MDRLAAMETFVRVADSGSFSAAASLLGVGQPAVSKIVAQLEERLAVRLVTRSTRGLNLTEAGLAFLDRARHVIAQAEEAERAARGAAAGLTGRLRVSAAVTFARLHLLPRLPGFMRAHPGLHLDVLLDDRSIDPVEEGVDLALKMGHLDRASPNVRKLAESPRWVVGAPDYFERHGIPKTPADLATCEAVVHARDGGEEVWTFRNGTTEVSVAVGGRLRVSAAEGVRAAVVAGLGLAAGSDWMFGDHIEAGRVSPILLDWSLPPTDLWAVFPSGRMASAKALAFADFAGMVANSPSRTDEPANAGSTAG